MRLQADVLSRKAEVQRLNGELERQASRVWPEGSFLPTHSTTGG